MADPAKPTTQASPPLYGEPINWAHPLKAGLFYIHIPVPKALEHLVKKLDIFWEVRRTKFEKSEDSLFGDFRVRLLPSSWIDLETLKNSNFKTLKFSLTGKKPGYVYCKRKWYDPVSGRFYFYVVVSNG